MSRLLAIGEALIDFIPGQSGRALKDVLDFAPKVGGAPANVCGAFKRLGGEASIITQLGEDPFGDKIVEEFERFGIGTEYVARTTKANTSLAFVALKEDGNREFSFYRKPGADMLLSEEQIRKEWFEDVYALHFCSVSLGNFPMREAHVRAIEYATEQGALISFDPNVRLALWDSEEELKKTILEFMPKAHILKISDEELEFITGKKTIEEAKELLFQGKTELVLYTKGSDGAEAYTKNAYGSADSLCVRAVDTTGAGDGYIGSFLYQLMRDNVDKEKIADLTEEDLVRYLEFSHKYCAMSVQRPGAIASYPTMEEMK